MQERYRELGRLRIGEIVESGGRRHPGHLGTWRLTSAWQKLLEAAAALWGGQVKVWDGAPTEGEQFELTTEVAALAVIVPPQDIDSNSWYELYTAGGIKRRCDGETDMISGRTCPCATKNARECKPTIHLKVMLPEIPDIGTWRLVTRGWNAAAELTQIVRLMNSIAPKTFAEASLRIESRTSKVENAQGKSETHHFTVPVLELPYSMGDLMKHAPTALVTGRGGRVPLSGDAPELPQDSRFQHNHEPDWGDRPGLPQASGEVGNAALAYGEGAALATSTTAEGTSDGQDGESVAPLVTPSEESSPGAGSEVAVTRPTPPADDPELNDEPAANWRWANAQAVGLTGNAALKAIHHVFATAGAPDAAPTSQSQITNRQLQAVIEETRKT